MDTSSAVVGSSATISLGSAASASAITTLAHPALKTGAVVVDPFGSRRNTRVLQQTDGRLRASSAVTGRWV